MRIGDVSKLLDLSPETIRYYEKEGILSPVRREDSTFRDYSIWDIFDLCECRKYREMDFTLTDARRMMKSEDPEGISRMLAGKYEEVLALANQKMILAAEVKALKDRTDNAPLNVGNYWFASEEEKVGIVFSERTGKTYSSIDVRNTAIQAWMSKNLFTYGYMLVSMDDLTSGRDQNRWAFVVTRKTFSMLDLPSEGCFTIPCQTGSINTVQS